ncbi:MAG: hypothetical protein RLZZ406_1041 [Pseudomonadota bacterium]|jgi:hypothetical protein
MPHDPVYTLSTQAIWALKKPALEAGFSDSSEIRLMRFFSSIPFFHIRAYQNNNGNTNGLKG